MGLVVGDFPSRDFCRDFRRDFRREFCRFDSNSLPMETVTVYFTRCLFRSVFGLEKLEIGGSSETVLAD